VIDYDSGNLCSVSRGLETAGAEVRIVRSAEEMTDARGLVLPGVGAFGDAMARLASAGLVDPIRRWIADGKPFLGICLGLQLLFSESEENPGQPGIGVFGGKVRRFVPDDPTLKVPHMGWNRLMIKQPTAVLGGIDEGSFVYFVHSYYVDPEERGIIATTTDYGVEFVSSIQTANVFACQFHPEKSQAVGLKMLGNFVGGLT
jgi:glutamine amidotransferase